MGFQNPMIDAMLRLSRASRWIQEGVMRKAVFAASAAGVVLGVCSAFADRAEATTFHSASAVGPASEAVSVVETTVCRFYPWSFPRSWAVFSPAWPCYPSYSYYYYPRYPYYYYLRDPHYEPGFIRRSL